MDKFDSMARTPGVRFGLSDPGPSRDLFFL